MKDEIEIGVKETAILKVIERSHSNITNCTCLVLESNIWNPGGRRGVEIPEVQVGATYKIISEVVACGYGIGWNILSIEKMQ